MADPATSGPLAVVSKGIAVTPAIISTVLHERMGSSSGSGVGAWFGIAFTVWITFASATFHTFAGLSAAVVQALFVIAGLVASVMTVITGISYIRGKKRSSVTEIVAEIVKRSQQW
jgi:hypothetical protein